MRWTLGCEVGMFKSGVDRAALLLALGVFTIKAGLAGYLGLIADEAYFWLWSKQLAWGYYDQPPLIAWLIASTSWLGREEAGVRLTALLCFGIALAALWPLATERRLLVLGSCLPVIFGLTLLETPDAPLIAAWAVGLWAASRGNWWLAGVASAAAILSKHTGIFLFPLLVLGARGWRDRRMWGGAGLALALLTPHLWWLSQHEWVTVAFQFREGLVSETPPGLGGVAQFVVTQMAVGTPILALTAMVFFAKREKDLIDRLAFWTSVPLFAFFAVGAYFAPSEAYWTAPAWVGVWLTIARPPDRGWRAAWASVSTAALVTGLCAAHLLTPLWPFEDDPADEFEAGRSLGEAVVVWSYPVGSVLHPPAPAKALPVWTERYQEAAWIAFYVDVPTARAPGCGRPDQFDVWATPNWESALLLRPARGGDSTCFDAEFPDRSGPTVVQQRRDDGSIARRWQIYEVAR